LSDQFFKVQRQKEPVVTAFEAFRTHIFEPVGPTVPVGLDYDFDAMDLNISKNEVRFPVYPMPPESNQDESLPFDVAHAEEETRTARNEALQLREEARLVRDEAKIATDAMRAEAEKILEDAKSESANILEQARRQVEVIEQQAYQAGFSQGEESGKTLGEQKIQSIVKNLNAVLENAGREVESLLKANEVDVTKAAIDLTLQLIHREIQQDPSVVLDMARAALRRIRNCSRLTFQVSSSDAAFIEGNLDELRTQAGNEVEIQVEVHPDIGRGGCRLLCDSGMVDATIETMVRNFLEQVMEEE
jgi:flagellar assembly protein FliH